MIRKTIIIISLDTAFDYLKEIIDDHAVIKKCLELLTSALLDNSLDYKKVIAETGKLIKSQDSDLYLLDTDAICDEVISIISNRITNFIPTLGGDCEWSKISFRFVKLHTIELTLDN